MSSNFRKFSQLVSDCCQWYSTTPLVLCSSFPTHPTYCNFSSLMRSYAISVYKKFSTRCVNFGQFRPSVGAKGAPAEMAHPSAVAPPSTTILQNFWQAHPIPSHPLKYHHFGFCGRARPISSLLPKLVPPLDLYCHFVRFDCAKQFPPVLDAGTKQKKIITLRIKDCPWKETDVFKVRWVAEKASYFCL